MFCVAKERTETSSEGSQTLFKSAATLRMLERAFDSSHVLGMPLGSLRFCASVRVRYDSGEHQLCISSNGVLWRLRVTDVALPLKLAVDEIRARLTCAM